MANIIKRLNTNFNGGFPAVLDDLRLIIGQSTDQDAASYFEDQGADDGIIISGCRWNYDTANSQFEVEEGYIYLNGEILHVAAQQVLDTGAGFCTLIKKSPSDYDAAGTKIFQDGNTHDTYEELEAVLVETSSPPSSPFIVFQSALAYNGPWHPFTNFDYTVFQSDYGNAAGDPMRCRMIHGKTVQISGTIIKTTPVSVNTDTHIANVPAGFFPKRNILRLMYSGSTSGATALAYVEISTSGQIRLRGDINAATMNNTVGLRIYAEYDLP